ncbi:MAG: GAF domain-containing SpoIIE family protein phosphatase [Candidatus Eisenbacteria bacterium]
MMLNGTGLATGNLVLGGLVFLLGLVILRENPGQRLNRVVSLLLFFGGFGAVLSALSLLAPAGSPAAALPENAAYLWQLFFPTAFLLASIFPEERGFTRRYELPGGWKTPSFMVVVFAPHVFHYLLVLVTSLWKPEANTLIEVPHMMRPFFGAIGVLARVFLGVHRSLFSLVDIGFGVGAIALLLGSWRRTSVPRIRAQLGAITVGLVGCLALYFSATSVPTLFGLRLSRELQGLLTTAALLFGSGAIAYAMVRYKFLDAKLIARRGILYALASALLIGFYLFVVERVNTYVSSAFGLDARVIEPVFLIMALTLFQPAIARLEQSLDQMFLRDPGDYRNVLRQLGRDLQTTIDLDDLLVRTVRTLTEALLLRSAYVVAVTREGPVSRAGAGEPLDEEAMRQLAQIAARLDAHVPVFRLADPVDGLRRADRELLVGRLGCELLLPLRWRGETLGVVLLGEKLTRTDYTSEDVTLLTSLVSQMAVSLQNALLLRDRLQVARLEEELHLAQQIQRTFLRSEFPAMPRCEVHAVNLPSRQVGGDYYDVVACEDGSFLVAVADVAGKGVPAALMSSMLQAALRTHARSSEDVSTILRNINALVYRSTAVHQFATFFLARVDASGRRLTFCNAGHNWPALVRRDGTTKFLERGGLLLGVLEDITLEHEDVALEPGDVLIAFTDGISEAANVEGELFGEQRVAEIVRALDCPLDARGIAARLLHEVDAHLGTEEAQDDRTLLVLRVHESADEAAEPRDGREDPDAETVGAR